MERFYTSFVDLDRDFDGEVVFAGDDNYSMNVFAIPEGEGFVNVAYECKN